MKEFIVVSAIVIAILLAGSSFTPTKAENSANDGKPTFYQLTPGVYVNGWPRFTVSYPKDWVELLPRPEEIFKAGHPGPTRSVYFGVVVSPWPHPINKFADTCLMLFRAITDDVTLVGDKPSRLRDGTPGRELEFQMVMNGSPLNFLVFAMKKGDLLIDVGVGSYNGKVGKDLKAIMYTLKFHPGKDNPVKVTPDVQEFLDKLRSDMVSHDVAKIMTHYSDRYLASGTKKGDVELYWRKVIDALSSFEVTITDFEAAGDKAYLAGFSSSSLGKMPLKWTSIIKENGEWKFYGNQRDPAP